MTFGGGIRIYYGIHENEVVLLLTGGNKNSQHTDICRAAMIWQSVIKDEK